MEEINFPISLMNIKYLHSSDENFSSWSNDYWRRSGGEFLLGLVGSSFAELRAKFIAQTNIRMMMSRSGVVRTRYRCHFHFGVFFFLFCFCFDKRIKMFTLSDEAWCLQFISNQHNKTGKCSDLLEIVSRFSVGDNSFSGAMTVRVSGMEFAYPKLNRQNANDVNWEKRVIYVDSSSDGGVKCEDAVIKDASELWGKAIRRANDERVGSFVGPLMFHYRDDAAFLWSLVIVFHDVVRESADRIYFLLCKLFLCNSFESRFVLCNANCTFEFDLAE